MALIRIVYYSAFIINSVHTDVLQLSASNWHFPHVLRQQFPEVAARMAGFVEVKFASYFKASGWGRLLCTLEYLLKFFSLVEIFNKLEYKIN